MNKASNTDPAAGVGPVERQVGRLYAERDVMAQGEHYTRHLMAMTAEGLHAKTDIAAELAHRDLENARLRLMLALRVAGVRLYTDDGEMSDATAHPPIDFKRDSVDEIERKLIERGLTRFWSELATGKPPNEKGNRPA